MRAGPSLLPITELYRYELRAVECRRRGKRENRPSAGLPFALESRSRHDAPLQQSRANDLWPWSLV